MVDQVTQEQAIALGQSKFWEGMSHEQIARFQLYQDRLCMPFGIFHEAVEKALGRPVWTHEFAGEAGRDALCKELDGTKPAPTFEEILNMIPAEKRVVIALQQ